MGFVIDGRYIQDHFPGIGRYTYNLIAALARVAPEEKFFVLYNPALKNTRYDIKALAQHPNIEIKRVDIPTFSLQEQTALSLAIRYSQYAIFHSPYFVKPYFLSVPSIVSIFDLIPIHYPNELPNAAWRLVFRLAISLAARTATRVIVPSVAARDDLVAHLRVPHGKIAVTLLGVESRFAPQAQAKIAVVRQKYYLPPKYILHVGSNKPHKNLGALIQAWEGADVDAGLVIAGAWDERYALTTAISEKPKRAKEILWIKNIDDLDLPALYSGATAFVMPSWYEGFGLPLLEAMACGTPVISSNASSLPEVGGDAALWFEPRDVNGLSVLIARAVNDRALQEELRIKSLARAKEFSWERTARETLSVYTYSMPKLLNRLKPSLT